MENMIVNRNGKELSYKIISQEEAREMMLKDTDYIILDVRTEEEYFNGHIKGAINIPNEEIGHEEIEALPDKNKKLLVYCRSGYRSKQAASKLAILGYKEIYEFGGIITWKYEIVDSYF